MNILDWFRIPKPSVKEKARNVKHGTVSTYTGRRCRCSECRAAMTSYYREYRARKKAEAKKAEARKKHGTLSAYTYYGCRCDECRTARREYDRNWYARRKAALS